MAYKFQLGAARMSGSLVQEGRLDAEGIVSGSGALQGASVAVDGNITAGLTISGSMLDGQIQNPGTALELADTDDVSEGSGNLYHTTARARGAISVTDAGGDGSLAYDSGTGVITFTGPSAAEVRAHLSAGEMLDYSGGEFSINAATFSASADVRWDAKMAAADTGDLAEGSNLYYTNARARAAVSEDADILSYDSGTGVLSVVGAGMSGSVRDIVADSAAAAAVRGHLSSGYMIDFASGEFAIDASEFSGSWADVLATKDTDDLAEGSSNLFFTQARARQSISVTDAGGDGSLAYDNSTGVITYTGPSAAEVRAHLSAGEMLDYSGGEFSINASTFSASADVRWDAKMAAADTGDLAEGSNLYFTNARARGAISEDADILSYDSGTGVLSVVGAGMSGSVRDIVADSAAAAAVRGHLSSGYMIDFASGEFAIDASEFSGSWSDALATKDTDDLAEGSSNLFFTDARARAAVSVTDAGGDGSLAYDSGTGVITYTGPSAAEVRAHFTAGDGLAVSAGDFSVNVDDSSIEINSDTLRVKAAGVTDAMLNDDVATGLAGNGLSAASGVMAVALNELVAAVVDVAADSIAFIDADDGNASKKESIADLVAAMAGDGLTATNGVLTTDSGNVAAIGDANATLAAGMNFGNATLSADRTWTLPASPEDGQVVHVKAPAALGGNNVIIARAGSQTIDGEQSIRLEGPGAAVSLMYIGSDAWAIF